MKEIPCSESAIRKLQNTVRAEGRKKLDELRVGDRDEVAKSQVDCLRASEKFGCRHPRSAQTTLINFSF